MLRKFKLEALVHRKTKKGRTLAWTNYFIMAHDPFDARNKTWTKYPGRHFARISECWPNGNVKIGRSWPADYLAQHAEELKILYDLEIEG